MSRPDRSFPPARPPQPLVSVRGLSKRFDRASRPAVDGVDLDVGHGEVVGLVGESGCGKSTLGRLILGLLEPSAGDVTFDGRHIGQLTRRERKALGRRMQVVFQNPTGSLSPKRTILQSVAEPLVVQIGGGVERHRAAVLATLEAVGLSADHLDRLPHQLSGGQRQRAAMARALVLEPRFIVADEPVSALDVSIQAQVLNLFRDLRSRTGFAMLFVSHDLAVVNYLADRVAVMHGGRLVEIGPREAVIFEAAHPYTRALVAAHAVAGAAVVAVDEGEAAAAPPAGDAAGCLHRPACPIARDICARERPALRVIGDDHRVACHAPAAATLLPAGLTGSAEDISCVETSCS